MTAIQYISQLGSAASVGTTDLVPITQGSTGPLTGTTRKIAMGTVFGSPLPIGQTAPDVGSFTKLSIGPTATAVAAAPRLFSVFGDQTLAGTSGVITRIGSILRGAQTSALTGAFITAVDEDRIAMSDPNDGASLVFNSATLRAGWAGGRTLAADQLYVGNPSIPGISAAGTAGVSAYHVAGSSFAYSYTDAGGTVGAERGNLFGRNDAVRVRTGSNYHWNSAFGNETDVGVEAGTEVLWKGGIKVVQWSTDLNRGVIQDYAYGINLQSGGTPPGWRIGFALGGFEGWWPFTADSTVMKAIDANVGGGPAKAFAAGIDFRGITIGESAFASPGYKVDGSGNLGALIASGVALQTRSAITAATAVVASATVLEGGLYSGAITLTCSAPTTSGTAATLAPATVSMPYVEQINTAGTGYAVGDAILYSGGTSTITTVGTITKVNGTGAVQGIKITTPGNYTVLPASPIATTTSGSGTGLTITPKVSLLTVSVSGAGTNYSEWLPPTVTSAGASATYRPALIKVAMTATAAPILLANNYANYAGFTGAASGGTFDASAPFLQAAGPDTHIDLKALGKGTNGRLNSAKLFIGPTSFRAGVVDATTAYFGSATGYTTTAAPSVRMGGNFFGTVTSGQAFYHAIAIDSDTVDPTTGGGPGGTYGLYVGHTLSAGAKGGRVAMASFLNISGAFTASASGDGRYQVSHSGFAQASASAGGTAGLGTARGNLFGSNISSQLLAGAGDAWNAIIGLEINVGASATTQAYYKNGLQIIQWTTDAVAGAGGMDSGIMLATQTGGSVPGWDMGMTFGHGLGWWPLKATATIIGTVAGVAAGPAYAAAWGIDFSAVTFSSGFLKSTGFEVDGSGVATMASAVIGTSGPTIRAGTGAASGTQPRGSLWFRTDGGVGSTLYVSQGGGTWNAVAGV